MLKDNLSQPSTTAAVNPEASQILTQALHLMCISDLRCKVYAIQFYWEQLIEVEGEKVQNSEHSTWTNPYTGPTYSAGQVPGDLGGSRAPYLSSAWATGHCHLPAPAFRAPGLPSKIFSENFRTKARSPHSRPHLHISNRPRGCTSPSCVQLPTFCKLSHTLIRSHSFLHSCTGDLQNLSST